MIGVVLAAGEGRRLRPLTERLPKALIPLWRNRTCLEQVLGNLKAAVEKIYVVTGYRAEMVEQALTKLGFLAEPIRIAQQTPGNLSSLIAVWPRIKGKPFILTNVDHVFPRGLFTELLKEVQEGEIACLVQSRKAREILEDEMKVVLDERGGILRFSKKLFPFDGAYVGVTAVKDPVAYAGALESLRSSGRIHEGSCVEDILEELSRLGKPPRAVFRDRMVWYEIDTPEDLEKARAGIGHDPGAYF